MKYYANATKPLHPHGARGWGGAWWPKGSTTTKTLKHYTKTILNATKPMPRHGARGGGGPGGLGAAPLLKHYTKTLY